MQALCRLIYLCSPRRLATHFGHATVTGRANEAFAHLRAVTGVTHRQALDHIRAAEQLWIDRSGMVWRTAVYGYSAKLSGLRTHACSRCW